MDPIKAKFFQASFDLFHGAEMISMRGLVSEAGITKIYVSGGLPEYWKGIVGQSVHVQIDNLRYQGVFLQQFVEHGSFYEVRFRDLSDAHRAFLLQRLASEGISPGWQRKFPRIPVGQGDDPDLPVPNLCMVRFAGQDVFVNVVNFTIGGLRVETLGDNLSQLRVGAVIHFDLMISNGSVLVNLAAEVRNTSTLEHDDQNRVTRAFGLRFLEMDPVNERKYKTMIRDYCLELQKRLNTK